MNWIFLVLALGSGFLIGLIAAIVIARMLADVHEEKERDKYSQKKK